MLSSSTMKILKPLAAVAVTTSLLYVGYRAVYGPKDVKQFLQNGEKVIELLEGEIEGMVHAPSITTVTFYEGQISEEYLKKRIEEILLKNPWLDSRLVTTKTRGGLSAVFNPLSPTRFAHFSLVKNPTISSECAYNDIMNKIDPLVVKMGRKCTDKEEPLFSVRLVEIEEKKRYALVVSMSHVIGDGHTYYQVSSMLSPESKVFALEYERNQSFMTELDRVQGPQINNWLRKPTTVIGFILNAVYRKAPYMGVYEINAGAIEKLKEERLKETSTTSPDVKFLSTNDVLTAEFFRYCESDYSLMCVNYRNRIMGFTDSMSGNYESLLVFDKEEAASPSALRESLSRGHSKSGVMPTAMQSLQSNIFVSTNWSTFYCEIKFPDAKQVIHLPVLKAADHIFMDAIVIFRAADKSLGVLYGGRKHDSASLKATAGAILGKQLLPDPSK
jgi:hypothetical protein